MKDRVIPIVVGLLAGWAIAFILERLNHYIYPTPAVGPDLTPKEGMTALMNSIPIGAFVLLFLSWMVSASVAGAVTARIYRAGWRNNVIIVGVILSIGALINMTILPHPTWLVIASGVGYVPCSYFGGTLFKNKKS